MTKDNKIKNNLYGDFLTEEKLGLLLKDIYKKDFIHNKQFPNHKFRPDYRNDELKLIVEFDGILHFTNSKRLIDDILRDIICYKLGYTVIRIPYFIDISKESIEYFFNINVNYTQKFPHGFINKGIVLPSDFCYLGYLRFLRLLSNIPEKIYNDIQISLNNKIENDNLFYYQCFSSLYNFYNWGIEQKDLILELNKYNITNYGYIILKDSDKQNSIYVDIFSLFLYKRKLSEIDFNNLLEEMTKYTLI